MQVTGVYDDGGDVLRVTGERLNGEVVEARGWVSATTHHYQRAGYDADGNLAADAAPVAMTAAETGVYALGLLHEQNPQARPAPIAFVAPTPTPVPAATL